MLTSSCGRATRFRKCWTPPWTLLFSAVGAPITTMPAAKVPSRKLLAAEIPVPLQNNNVKLSSNSVPNLRQLEVKKRNVKRKLIYLKKQPKEATDRKERERSNPKSERSSCRPFIFGSQFALLLYRTRIYHIRLRSPLVWIRPHQDNRIRMMKLINAGCLNSTSSNTFLG